MEDNFLLLYYGKFQYSDLCYMTREERLWMLKRISEEVEKKNDAEKAAAGKAHGSSKNQQLPNFPQKPSAGP